MWKETTYYAKFVEKEGIAGYNLGGGNWTNGIPNGLEDNSSGTSPKYPYKTKFEYGDRFTVINDIPVKAGDVFLGWYQKKAGENNSAIVHAGDTVMYPYKEPNRYTLDALWANLNVEGTTVDYDGKGHSITDEITFNNSLPDDLKEQVKKLITEGTTWYRYSQDNGNIWTEWTKEQNPLFVDAGTYIVQVKQEVTVDGKKTILEGRGELKINPREIELTAKSDEKAYDGTALTNSGYDITKGSFVEGEGLKSVTVEGSQTLVGEGKNTITGYELNDKTKAKNYTITTKEGKLKVTDREEGQELKIEVKANSKTAEYNGSEQSVSGLEKTTFEVNGVTYTVEGLSAEAKGTDAGSYPSEVTGTAKVLDAEKNDVTKQFQVTKVNGELKINPREIELTAKSDEKAYDGTALTNSGYDITKGSFVEGEGLKSVTVEGSQTLVGEGKNIITGYELNDKTKAKNYTITTKEGKLKVTDREEGQELKIEVKANSKTAEYNGSEQSVSGLEKTTFEVNGVTYTVEGLSAEAKGTDAGSYPSEVTGTAKVLDAEKNDVTKQFQVTKVNGELKINPREIELTTENATKTYDGTPLTAGGTVEGIVLGESYGFKLTGSQTLVGNSRNTYELTWAEEGNDYTAKASNYYMTKETLGTLTVTDGSEEEPINPEDVVKKTHGTPEGGVYKAGDVVTFTVTATNIYDEVKTITLNEIAGVTLKDTVFADVQPGETVETTATYTITEADVLAGEFVNTVTASFSGEEDTPFEDDDQVDEIEEPKGHLTIDKVTTSEPANGSSYALGETITYKITATNDGNLTLTNVKVVDELTGDEWEIASLAPGASEEFDTSYTVTEADILAGSVVNTATAEGTSPDPDKPDVPVNPGEEEEPTETEKPSLFVEKTAQPDEDGVYNLGDEIHYVIKVTNNGNVTVNDITVKDELTGDEWQLDSLTPGESEEYHATYTVTEEDILAGSITNVATAEGTDPDEDPVDQEGEETVPTDSADSHLTIHKATTSDPGEDGVYDLGDTITYEIIAANDGNVTLNNVVVTDELTGDEWIIETLAPGVSETFEAEYVVTEEDIHNGSVVNEATATAEGPEEPVITPGETEDETNPENPSLTVDKSIVEEKRRV